MTTSKEHAQTLFSFGRHVMMETNRMYLFVWLLGTYQEMKSSVGNNVLSLTVNADGAPIFKSSNTSAWPLMCSVSELPPTARSLLVK